MSISKQTNQSYEVILVDDGSTDDSSEICDKWVDTNDKFHIIHQSNAGLAAARNSGLDAAVGNYIVFVDSDDWVSKQLCQTLAEIFQETHADAAYYNYTEESVSASRDNIHIPPIQDKKIDSSKALNLFFQGKIQSHSWQLCCPRTLYQSVRFPVGRLLEDYATTYRLLAEARYIYFTSSYLYHYRLRDGSIMRNKNTYLSEQLIDSQRINLREIRDFASFNGPAAVKAFYPVYVDNLLWLYGRAPTDNISSDLFKEITAVLSQAKHYRFDAKLKLKVALFKLRMLRWIYQRIQS